MNMMNRKGQGLPINTIILIAIGLLILVLFITFILGGFKGLAPVSPNSLSSFEAVCSASCVDAASANSPVLWCSYSATVNSIPDYHCYNSSLGNTGTTCALNNGTIVVGPNSPDVGVPGYQACS